MTTTELWKIYNDKREEISVLRQDLEKIQQEINQAVADQFSLEQVLMTRWGNCPESPTGFCFTDPNAGNPWLCVFCKVDGSKPR